MNKFLEYFNDALFDECFEQYKINSGGCAKAAVLFYKYFKPIKEIEIKGALILNYYSPNPKQSVTNAVKGYSNIIEYCNHVVLVIKSEGQTYVVDAVAGVVPKEVYLQNHEHITGYMKIKLLKSICKAKDSWNPRFNVYDLAHLRNFLKEHDYYDVV